MSNTFQIDVDQVLAVTDKAMLCLFETGDELWVPRSVIDEDESEVWGEGDAGRLVVKAWWANKEGLS